MWFLSVILKASHWKSQHCLTASEHICFILTLHCLLGQVAQFKRVVLVCSAFGEFAVKCFSYATEKAMLISLSFVKAPMRPLTNFSRTNRKKVVAVAVWSPAFFSAISLLFLYYLLISFFPLSMHFKLKFYCLMLIFYLIPINNWNEQLFSPLKNKTCYGKSNIPKSQKWPVHEKRLRLRM